MRTPVLIAILFAFSFAGCTRSGDFGTFVVSEATKYGGHTKTNAPLPKLEARWTTKRDKNGFQASVAGASFNSVDTFMRQAFGTPKMSGFSTNIGQPYGAWAAADIGVAIQLIGRPEGVDIICVRAMSMTQMFKEMEKPWWKKLW